MQSTITSGQLHEEQPYSTGPIKELSQEEKLALLAAIVESSGDAIISKTLEGIITSWNNTAERIFGYTANEIIGRSIALLIPPERLNEETTIIERLKRGERVEHFETQRLTKDKRLLDISLTISPVKDSKGRIIGASKIARNITEQKEAERGIKENEERLRMAIESTQLGTWEYFPLEGKLIWSEECRKLYGAPKDLELNYSFFSDHVHPDDKELVQEGVSRALDPGGEGNYDIQYRILRYNDKQSRWIRAKGKAFFNAAQQADRFIGTVVDINDEKLREQELKDSVELFTVMANNVPAMIWMSGNDKFHDYFNNTWLEFTGRNVEQEKNEGWLQSVHPEDAPRCLERFSKALEEQVGFYSEYRLKRYDGEYRWVADNTVSRYNPTGEFAGFISACIDIDDQKRFNEKIKESELLLKNISNASPVALWMTDTDAQSTFVNETWIEWTGIPLEAHVESGWQECLVEEDRTATSNRFMDALQKKEKFSSEFRIRRVDGEIRWCLSEGYPYYDINNAFAGYAGSVTDITELKKMEQRKDDFIQMASHELKTPITSIKGYVQLLLSIYNEWSDEKLVSASTTVKTSLQTISKQVARLTRLVSELLDLSRIESGKLEMNMVEFDLGALVVETVEDVRHTSAHHIINIHQQDSGTVFGDRDRISQALVNLLTNAIKYSPDADKVDVYVEADNNTLTVRVKDYGIGIDKKDQQKIFDRFYRVEGKSEQTYPGFGIGLFIASEIVQRHNGSLTVESEKGKGAVFSISLPAS